MTNLTLFLSWKSSPGAWAGLSNDYSRIGESAFDDRQKFKRARLFKLFRGIRYTHKECSAF